MGGLPTEREIGRNKKKGQAAREQKRGISNGIQGAGGCVLNRERERESGRMEDENKREHGGDGGTGSQQWRLPQQH